MGAGHGEGDSPWVVTAGEQSPQAVRRLLGLLPSWFGIEASNKHYIEMAGTLPTYLAWPARSWHAAAGRPGDDQAAGVLLAKRHFPGAAEIYFLAVDPAVHRRGAGRALLRALERDLTAGGAPAGEHSAGEHNAGEHSAGEHSAGKHILLQVKTLGPSHPDPGYAATRLFYQGTGFAPLEEIEDLWPGNPCLVMVKVLPGM